MKKQPLKFSLNEWLGAFGDIGTFLPLYLALVALTGLSPVRPLILIGLVYIITALYFRLPIPVQPLKAMAAIAIAKELSPAYLSAASIWIAIILLALVLTRKIEWLQKYFTRPIVKGIQLGVGLMLIQRAIVLFGSSPAPLPLGEPVGIWDGFNIAIVFSSLWILVLPQLPLTLGNAVFAVSDVAKDYFGQNSSLVTPRKMATSIGLSDLIIGAFGGLPICHGSGGLTAHVRFGAKSGGATFIVGSFFLILAIFLPKNIYTLFAAIPSWFLAGMVFYVGVCHAILVKGCETKRVLSLGIGLVGLLTHNLALALAFGFMVDRLPAVLKTFFERKTDEPRITSSTIKTILTR